MNEELLKDYVRPVREEDRGVLPVFSYSKIDTYKNCAYQFDLKYNQGKYSNDTSIALELGSLLHYVLEQKGKVLAAGQLIDYNELNEIIQNGTKETDEKTKEQLLGIKDLKKKYWEIWNVPDSEGRTYDQKLELFDDVLHSEMENDDWEAYLFEHAFEFVWNDRVILKGFIDRVDKRGEELRCIDYKTSKKVFNTSSLATSLQFGIYNLSILNEFGRLCTESVYRFIFLDDAQKALTKGWEKRLIKALDGIFDKIDADNKSGIWVPKPSPLCHWCFACSHNPDATQYKYDCEYYSLWTPDNKTFSVNRQFDSDDLKNPTNNPKLNENKERKLIF